MPRQIKSQIAYRKSHIAKELFLCLLCAILLILSFPKFNLEFLAWFGFVPLFFALKNKSKTKAFLLSYFTGIIFWFGIIYWLAHVTLAGLIALVLYLALYFGIFGLIISSIVGRPSSIIQLFIPSIWVLLEYIRSHLLTGFPWALLGYSQYLNLPIIQIADITGVWGVSFLVMIVNITVYSSIVGRPCLAGRQASPIREIKKCLTLLLCLGVTFGYGYYKMHRTPYAVRRTPIKISVIQGNIPQELKWDPGAKDFIIDKYMTLTEEAVKDKPDLIIWPEAAMPVILEEEPSYFEKLKSFVRRIKTPLLLGAVTLRKDSYYNSALLVSAEGRLLEMYDKLHLVPFGEYIPLKKAFPFLETIVPIGDFTAGKAYIVYQLPVTFSGLICFEDLFPELSRRFVNRGANFLVNITNDAWFKKTSSPYQHLQASVFRAVENRVFLVRAANTGVSGFIDPNGKIISLVRDKSGREIFISGYRTEEINIPQKSFSFYTRYGDIFIIICCSVGFWFMAYIFLSAPYALLHP